MSTTATAGGPTVTQLRPAGDGYQTNVTPAADMPGAVDVSDVHYVMTREGIVPHVLVGELPPGPYIGRRALCTRIAARLATPAETESGRLCARCYRLVQDVED